MWLVLVSVVVAVVIIVVGLAAAAAVVVDVCGSCLHLAVAAAAHVTANATQHTQHSTCQIQTRKTEKPTERKQPSPGPSPSYSPSAYASPFPYATPSSRPDPGHIVCAAEVEVEKCKQET